MGLTINLNWIFVLWRIPDGPLRAEKSKAAQTVCKPSMMLSPCGLPADNQLVHGNRPGFFLSLQLINKTSLAFHRIPTVSLWGVSLLISEQGG